VKLAALMLAAAALFTFYACLVFVGSIGLRHFSQFPGLMAITVVLWIVTIGGGPIAAIGLWRSRRSGWLIGLVVFAVGLLYYTVGYGVFGGPGAYLPVIVVAIAFHLLGIVLLSLPASRRAIRSGA
jgi:hypothetical protein